MNNELAKFEMRCPSSNQDVLRGSNDVIVDVNLVVLVSRNPPLTHLPCRLD